jgi:hypothetical protein
MKLETDTGKEMDTDTEMDTNAEMNTDIETGVDKSWRKNRTTWEIYYYYFAL